MTRKYLTPIVLPADPAAALEAATKQYVDAKAKSAAQSTFQWNTTTTMADPGSGYMRANAAPASATQLAVSIYDVDGTARISLLELEAGDKIALYYDNDLSRYVKYVLSGAITNNANTWIQIPVTLDTSSGTYAPSNNQRITAIWSATAGGAGAYLPLSGGTLTGLLTLSNSASAESLKLTRQVVTTTSPYIGLYGSGGVRRGYFGVSSDLDLTLLSDSGVIKAQPSVNGLVALASGVTTITASGSPAAASAAVTFPAGRFSTTPAVTTTMNGGSNVHISGVSGVTSSGCNVTVFRRDGAGVANGNYGINWIAVETA